MKNKLRLGHIRFHELEIVDLEREMKFSDKKEHIQKRIDYHREQIGLLKGEKDVHQL